jgi:spermidine synthase
LLIYLLFFLSGLSGLIYQVIWVRMFGNVFGNTIYSASIVVAVFMLGLGVGSYVVGTWADRRYARLRELRDLRDLRGADSLLRTYGYVELAIAALGFTIAAALPHLGALSALISSYTRDASGWYALSTFSYVARGAIAVLLLTPITLLMGGTLTLLIRHLVRQHVDADGWRIAALYGINTIGAALGCALTDFRLVPAIGLWGTQMVAVVFNIVAGAGALYLVRLKPDTTIVREKKSKGPGGRLQADREAPVVLTAVALALTGFAALGMEILWFRHFTILLGGFRAVFSLLLTVILLGIGAGAFAGGYLHRRIGRPAALFMVAQGVFVAATLAGFAAADVRSIDAIVGAAGGAANTLTGLTPAEGTFAELWFNVKPMLIEVALPALLMGFSFPLGNALVQHAEAFVGRRAGILYLANTIGAVMGSLVAGFILLPFVGLQAGVTILTAIAALALLPLFFAASAPAQAFVGSLAVAAAALGFWLMLPADYIVRRTIDPEPNERILTMSDGVNEVIAVTELPGKGRTLVTNGHPMSSTWPLSQRYMRALAHIPLLSMDNPQTALVIGFGVGNTTQAASLHRSITHIELVDLSRDILAHASYFGNQSVLRDRRLAVYINDGRQHLQMRPPASYDLITLEPPPIGYAGVSALYSKEFYGLARARLKPDGYISQWLPAYQVPSDTTLSMIRAFIDVFPQAVLLSGAGSDLVLLGTNASRIEIDPGRVAARLTDVPPLRADLEQVDLGTVREIVGTFVGSAQTLADATRDVMPVVDDRPRQEYGVRSILAFGHGVPSSAIDVDRVADWCPRCFSDGVPAPDVEELETYMALLKVAYAASPAEAARARNAAGRTIAGSAYLGAIVPDTADLHNVLGISLAGNGRFEEAIAEFRRALELDPGNSQVESDLGMTLAASGNLDEAIEHLEKALALEPDSTAIRRNLSLLRNARR